MKFKLIFLNNYFTKEEFLHSNTSNQLVKVIKVYDRIWWRKLFIKWNWIKPTNTIKVTTKW